MNIKKWFKKLNPMENNDSGFPCMQIMLLVVMSALIAMDKPGFFMILCGIFISFFCFYLWICGKQKKYVVDMLKAENKKEAYSSYVYLKYLVHEKGFFSSFFSFVQVCFMGCLNIKTDNNIFKINSFQSAKTALFSWSDSSYMLFLNWGVLFVFAAAFYLLFRNIKPHLAYKKSQPIVENDAILLSKYNGLYVEEDKCFEKFRELAAEQKAGEERAMLSELSEIQCEKTKTIKRL